METLASLYKNTFNSYAQKDAVAFNGTTLTFDELRERAMKLANALLASGLNKGDRVGILASNRIEHLELDIAVAVTGLIKVPLNYRLHPREHEYMIENSQMNFLLGEEQLLEDVKTDVNIVCYGDEYERWIAPASSEDPGVEVFEDDLFAIMYTSGTTGKPKGAMQTHRNYISCALNLIIASGMNNMDVIGHVAPLTHGTVTMAHCALLLGAKQIIFNKFEPEQFLEEIEKEKITAVFLVPTMVNLMLHDKSFPHRDLSSLRTINMAGAPMAATRIRATIEQLGPVIVETYGQVEAPLTVSVMPKNELYDNPHSCGKIGMFAEVRIVDESGKDVAPGEVGEIICKGSLVMKGYWNNPEGTKETIKDGWLHTGDLGRVDEDGYLYIVDRTKDVIISGGANIYPREVEEVLNLHPDVKEVCVFGIEDEKWGEAVIACIVPAEGRSIEEKELIDICENNMASYKKPKEIHFVERLPKSSYGKILRREMEQFYRGNIQ